MNLVKAIYQNIMTLSYLEGKDYENAVILSLSALSCLHTTSGSLSHQKDQTEPEATTSSFSLDQHMLLFDGSDTFDEDENDEEDDDATHTMFIYDRGILIPQRSTTDLAIITPILVFNAALAHHLLAEARDGGSPTPNHQKEVLLQRAKRLYELANGSQEAAAFARNNTLFNFAQNNTLFNFAITNNIAVIDRQLGNTQLFDRCLGPLLSTLMLFVDQERTAELHYLRGFWRNLLCTRRQVPGAA